MRWPILAYLPAVVAPAAVRRRVGLPRPLTIPAASAAPLAVVMALPGSKWRSAAVWAAYLWLCKVAHQVPFDNPDKIKERVRVRQSVRLDSLIGAGAPLPLRLQRALRVPPRLTLLDWTLSALYYATREVGHAARAKLRAEPRAHGEQGDWREHGNPWASMPSEHFVGAATAALWLAEQGDEAGALGLTYLVAVAFIVLYLGEHYVIDLAAALAVAEAVRRADPLLDGLARAMPAAARALPRLAA